MKGINVFTSSKLKNSQQFDYIIVGGGTAGCVLANRLSEDGTKSVLVLEAGSSEFNHKNIQTPIGALKVPNAKFDWCDSSDPDTNIANRKLNYSTGKVLGGTSCTNNMLYNRGDANDYKNWSESVKDEEWSADNVLTFFKMSEDDSRGASKYHGTGGEFNVSDVRYQNPLSKAFLAVCGENGLPANDDFNDWSRPQEGYGRYQVNEKEGSRCSTASGFLAPAMKRRNLTVVPNAMVTRVTFSGTEAVGVDAFIDSCRQHIVLKHCGEIILTAGAVSNPQILLLSGIGPRSHLHHYGVADIVELPGVGKNLQDQATALVTYECIGGNEGTSLTSVTRITGTALQNPKSVLEWLVTKSGPFTSPGPDHGAFFKTKEKLASPDLQIKFVAAVSSRADGLKLHSSKTNSSAAISATPSQATSRASSPFNSSSTNLTAPPTPPTPEVEESAAPEGSAKHSAAANWARTPSVRDGFTFQATVTRPLSKGYVELSSDNPIDRPLIRAGYFSDADMADIATLREGIKLARRLARSDAFAKFTGEEIFPGIECQSDSDLDDYIRNTVHSNNSLCGTCKMGPRSDTLSVVGSDLKVHGIKGLRVADASVVPKMPGGDIAVISVMIAEKAAAFINPKPSSIMS